MRFARHAAILQAAVEDSASRAQSGPNPRDSWPSWTDAPIPFRLAPEPLDAHPQLVADPSPRRRAAKGGGL